MKRCINQLVGFMSAYMSSRILRGFVDGCTCTSRLAFFTPSYSHKIFDTRWLAMWNTKGMSPIVDFLKFWFCSYYTLKSAILESESAHSLLMLPCCRIGSIIAELKRIAALIWSLCLLKLRSSRAESNRPLRATCTKTAVPTWFAEAIWTLLLFWPTVARRGRLDPALDERSLSFGAQLTK